MASNNSSLPTKGVGSLSTLLKRLEAATSRLEDIAMAQVTPNSSIPYGVPETYIPESAFDNNNNQNQNKAIANNPVSPPTTAKPTVIELPKSVKGFQVVVENGLAKYLALSSEIGGLVQEQAVEVERAFVAQKAFLLLASACVKPASTSPGNAALLHPTESAVVAAVQIREKNRSGKEANQLSTVAEGLPALGWVTMDSKPGPFVSDFKESAQFYANRVVKDNKETNPKQVEWARSFIALLEDLRKYIMEYHTTTLTWNPQGIDSANYTTSTPLSTSSSSFSSTPSPPPPPPPPAPPAPTAPTLSTSSSTSSTSSSAAGGDMGGVFAALNKGESVTSGLKKVDPSEMTHKNPELRVAGVVSAAGTGAVSKGGPQKPPKPQTMSKKPPKTELEGNKWNIENHENNQTIVIDQTEINQIVNIFNLKSCVVQIKGKVNAISLVNCSKTSILLDSTVSSLAISTSPSFTVQILGKVPTILIDGTDGGQVYLSKDSMDVEIISAKSSSINISLPVEGEEEGIFEEKAVPEQFKTLVKNGKLVTTVVEHSG